MPNLDWQVTDLKPGDVIVIVRRAQALLIPADTILEIIAEDYAGVAYKAADTAWAITGQDRTFTNEQLAMICCEWRVIRIGEHDA